MKKAEKHRLKGFELTTFIYFESYRRV